MELSLKKENIEAVKREIQNCCQKESANILIHAHEQNHFLSLNIDRLFMFRFFDFVVLQMEKRNAHQTLKYS